MRLPERVGDQVRIGVSITVPEPYGQQLQTARAELGDPQAEFIPPHITLLGPTVVEPSELAKITAHLEEVAERNAPFVMLLRGTGSFRPVSPVVFVQVAEGIAGCEELEVGVRSGPLESDLRFNYHPHVTIAHELGDADLDRASASMADFEATFVVTGFQMFEHGDDEVWRPVRDFVLGGAGSTDVGADDAPADAELDASV